MKHRPCGNGKGDTPRPIKDREKFDSNWDAIFGKKDVTKKQHDLLQSALINSSQKIDRTEEKENNEVQKKQG